MGVVRDFSPARRTPADISRSSGAGRLPSSFARREAALGATDHEARSRRGTIAARAFRISEVGVLSRRLAPGTTPAADSARTFILDGQGWRFRPVSDATTVAARPDSIAPTAR